LRRLVGIILAAAWLAACSPSAEPAGWFGGAVDVPDRAGDAAVAAGSVRVVGVVRGDALIASGDIQVLGDVGGDIRALAGHYEQSGSAQGEVSLAAGTIVLDGMVGDDFWAAGEDIELRRESRIGEDARIAGEDVLIKGRIDGDLDVVADQVAIDAQIGGDVVINARRVIIGPGATINGRLRWRAQAMPVISEDAIIHGGTSGKLEKAPAWRWRGPHGTESDMFANAWLARLAIGISAFLLGLLVLVVAPKWASRAVHAARGRWAMALALGAAACLAGALAVALLAVIAFGLPLALALVIAAPLAGAIGYVLAAIAIGALVLELAPRRSSVWAHLALGIALLSVLGLIPWIGGWTGPAAVCFGLGGCVLARLMPQKG
jgi:cytoskeletal protein CcmA (bactofilin family)